MSAHVSAEINKECVVWAKSVWLTEGSLTRLPQLGVMAPLGLPVSEDLFQGSGEEDIPSHSTRAVGHGSNSLTLSVKRGGSAHGINCHEINSREINSYIFNFSRGQLHDNQHLYI